MFKSCWNYFLIFSSNRMLRTQRLLFDVKISRTSLTVMLSSLLPETSLFWTFEHTTTPIVPTSRQPNFLALVGEIYEADHVRIVACLVWVLSIAPYFLVFELRSLKQLLLRMLFTVNERVIFYCIMQPPEVLLNTFVCLCVCFFLHVSMK